MTLASCSNNKTVSIAEEHLKEQLLDKNTYEQISVKVDTLLRSRELIIESESDSSSSQHYKYCSLTVNKTTSIYNLLTKLSDSFSKEQKIKIKLYQEIMGTSKDTIVQFNVKFRFYSVNRLGTRGIYDGIVVIGTDGKPKDVHYYDK